MKLLKPDRLVKWINPDTKGWETGRVLLTEYGTEILRMGEYGTVRFSEILVQLTYGGVAFIRRSLLEPGYEPTPEEVEASFKQAPRRFFVKEGVWKHPDDLMQKTYDEAVRKFLETGQPVNLVYDGKVVGTYNPNPLSQSGLW